jgi:hypothetical protein
VSWITIDTDFCNKHSGPIPKDRVLRYFDGRIPTWADALSDEIPRRQVVQDIVNSLAQNSGESGIKFHLILGASGEGKSTILRQAAVDIARTSPSWRVLWREPMSEMAPALVTGLPKNLNWLLVSDDAEQIIDECFYAVQQLNGENHVHFLLAARDTDWRNAGGFRKDWRTYVLSQTTTVRGLAPNDARLIVRSWTRLGAEGLKLLESYKDEDERVEILVQATKDEATRGEGAFLGGMLRVRYGEDLEAHVRSLMRRLGSQSLRGNSSLLGAFIHIAALHAANIVTLTPDVLAEAIGMSRDEIEEKVIIPLGEEAAVTVDGGYVLVRHRAIAEAAMNIAESFNLSSPELYSRLTRAAIRTYKKRIYVPNLQDYRYMSKLFPTRPDIAVATAQAAFREEADDLRSLVNYCIALNNVGKSEECIFVAQQSLPELANMKHWDTAVRRFYLEWSVAEGERGRHAVDCWLAAVSLADLQNAAELDRLHIEFGLSSIGAALLALLKTRNELQFQLGVRALDVLSRGLNVARGAQEYFDRYRSEADRLGMPEVDKRIAMRNLIDAIVTAWSIRERELSPLVPSAMELRFRGAAQELKPIVR